VVFYIACVDVYCIVDIVSLVDQLRQSPSIAYAMSLCSRAAASTLHYDDNDLRVSYSNQVLFRAGVNLLYNSSVQLQLCISDCLHSCSVCSVRVTFSCSPPTITTLTTTTELRFDHRLTPMRLHYDHSTTYVTTVGLPVCGLLH